MTDHASASGIWTAAGTTQGNQRWNFQVNNRSMAKNENAPKTAMAKHGRGLKLVNKNPKPRPIKITSKFSCIGVTLVNQSRLLRLRYSVARISTPDIGPAPN